MQDNRQVRLKQGYVYLVSNSAFEGWVKVGCAVDVEARLRSYQTSDPNRGFRVLLKRFVPDRRAAEAALLEEVAVLSPQGEWVRADPELMKEIFRRVQKKLLTPEA